MSEEQQIIAADLVYGDRVGGDKVGGDKITVGDLSGSYNAIGAGAQVIVTQIQQALSAVDEMEKGIQAAERRLAAAIQQKIGRYAHLTAPTEVDARENPYKALLDYKLEDAPFFYGRSQAVKVMWQKMGNGRLTILHSESGSGKTSLLQAGLASRLLADGRFPLYLRPYRQSPDQFIKKEFLPDYAAQPELRRFRDDQMSLKGFLERTAYYLGGRQIYIFLDQFEEFFTEQSPEMQRAFAGQLQECVESDLPVRWVLSLRKEYFSDLRLFGALRPFDNEYFLPTFRLEEAQEVVTEPAALKGVQYEAGLVDHILSDLRQEDKGIPPAQVQLVCYTLFDELPTAEDGTAISHALYDKPRGRGAGEPGAKGILTSHLSRVLDRELKGAERRIANRILEELVTSDVRRAVRSREQLAGELETADPAALEHVLTTLHENRLIRRDLDEDDQPLYELTHDYLLSEIELDPETQARKAAQELLARELAAYRQFGTLLSKDRFDIIHSQLASLKLEETAVDLLQKSETALEAEQQRELQMMRQLAMSQTQAAQRLRWAVWGLTGVTAAMLVIIGILITPFIQERWARAAAMGEMVYIPGGSFLFGKPEPQVEIAGFLLPTWPQQEVRHTEFWIDKYEVTNRQYRLCHRYSEQCKELVQNNEHLTDPNKQNHPVVNVSLLHANAYCQWLGKRLPTEVEWERAARGLTGDWPWGKDDPMSQQVNMPLGVDPNRDGNVEPVNSRPEGVSSEGVYHLVGNVWEWTTSYWQVEKEIYDPDAYWDGQQLTHQGEQQFVLRGGGWEYGIPHIAAAFFSRGAGHDKEFGIRCAADSPP
jgi:formylglycine-generating enzyme required for sulfatase activity